MRTQRTQSFGATWTALMTKCTSSTQCAHRAQTVSVELDFPLKGELESQLVEHKTKGDHTPTKDMTAKILPCGLKTWSKNTSKKKCW